MLSISVVPSDLEYLAVKDLPAYILHYLKMEAESTSEKSCFFKKECGQSSKKEIVSVSYAPPSKPCSIK